ncbi:MAG: LLM class flavin-dependent oxidoreductase [Roseiflexaceae bacterium]
MRGFGSITTSKNEDIRLPIDAISEAKASVDALTMYGAAFGRTKSIRLGTSIVPTYPRHPLAQQAATVDALGAASVLRQYVCGGWLCGARQQTKRRVARRARDQRRSRSSDCTFALITNTPLTLTPKQPSVSLRRQGARCRATLESGILPVPN